MQKTGAYILHIDVLRSIKQNVGMLRNAAFPAGRYLYVGSARKGIAQRVARHQRLAATKNGKIHWHIDHLLVHPDARLNRVQAIADGCECKISKQIAARKNASIPVLHFGATDCTEGCKSHLYRVSSLRSSMKSSNIPLEANRANARSLSRAKANHSGESIWTSQQSSFIAKEKKDSSTPSS
jgi:Uri superfamily endonuclease